MKTGFNFNEGVIRILYYQYKSIIFPSVIVVLSIFIFFIFIFPQYQELSDLKTQQDTLSANVALLKNNENILVTVDDTDITNRLTTTTKALPQEKDFIGVLSAISKASVKSGVSVSDFSFTVGDLATASAALSSQLSLQMSLSLTGSVQNVDYFIKVLTSNFPLAEVTSLQASDTSSTIKAIFYYKPFPPLVNDVDAPVQPLTAEEIKAIDALAQMNQ